MGFLKNFLGITSKRERAGLSLGDDAGWEVACPRDAAAFFEALGVLAPADAVLAVQDPLGPEVRRFLEERVAADRTRVRAGTIWPRVSFFHVRCSPENLAGLAELARRHSSPEMAAHLHVYRAGRVIVEWYDAFDIQLYVSKEVDEESIRKFCRAVQTSYTGFNP
jgi:hypothetical protein